MKNPAAIAKDRPAETAAPVAMAAAIVICSAAGVDDAATIGYVAICVAFVPAGITWVVELVRGGGSARPESLR